MFGCVSVGAAVNLAHGRLGLVSCPIYTHVRRHFFFFFFRVVVDVTAVGGVVENYVHTCFLLSCGFEPK